MVYVVSGLNEILPIIQNNTVRDCLEYFKNHTSIQVDTETTGLDPHSDKIVTLQLGDRNNQWVIDARYINILEFKELLESKLCILHNSKFDYKFLKKAGIVLNRIYDTMLAECVLFCGTGTSVGLASTLKRYTGEEMSKEERESFKTSFKTGEPLSLKQIIYAAKDVEFLEEIKERQEVMLARFDLEYCINLENEAVKALGDMEYNGIYLDSEEWLEIARKTEAELMLSELSLDNMVESEPLLEKFCLSGGQLDIFGQLGRRVSINYRSPLQIKEIAHSLGFVDVTSTSDRELTKLSKKHKFFSELQRYRELSKIISTYGRGFLEYINPETGRVHTDFWQIKETGRLSSGSKDVNAPNIQNIPGTMVEIITPEGEKIQTFPFRNSFKARPGFKWISIDYSGQELRLMADASGEEGFIDVLNRGEDLHCYVGTMMFKKPITKKDKDLRHKAKTINFGKP